MNIFGQEDYTIIINYHFCAKSFPHVMYHDVKLSMLDIIGTLSITLQTNAFSYSNWSLGSPAWLLFGWIPSLRLAVRTWKLMVGRRSFHFGFLSISGAELWISWRAQHLSYNWINVSNLITPKMEKKIIAGTFALVFLGESCLIARVGWGLGPRVVGTTAVFSATERMSAHWGLGNRMHIWRKPVPKSPYSQFWRSGNGGTNSFLTFLFGHFWTFFLTCLWLVSCKPVSLSQYVYIYTSGIANNIYTNSS